METESSKQKVTEQKVTETKEQEVSQTWTMGKITYEEISQLDGVLLPMMDCTDELVLRNSIINSLRYQKLLDEDYDVRNASEHFRYLGKLPDDDKDNDDNEKYIFLSLYDLPIIENKKRIDFWLKTLSGKKTTSAQK